MRSDAAANRDRVLAAAVTSILREGPKVPMATIAAEARVGVGTLYRRYPTRAALLSALETRAYRIVLSHAHDVEAGDERGIVAIDRFLHQTIEHRSDLVLPMHGGPIALDADSVALRAEISAVLQRIVERGQRDGTIRAGVTAMDVIIAGAMLAQPLAAVPEWDLVAGRHKQIFINGIAVTPGPSLDSGALSRADLEASFRARVGGQRT